LLVATAVRLNLGDCRLGLDYLRRYLQGLPVTERTDFERV
jgi:hypothetical protein